MAQSREKPPPTFDRNSIPTLLMAVVAERMSPLNEVTSVAKCMSGVMEGTVVLGRSRSAGGASLGFLLRDYMLTVAELIVEKVPTVVLMLCYNMFSLRHMVVVSVSQQNERPAVILHLTCS